MEIPILLNYFGKPLIQRIIKHNRKYMINPLTACSADESWMYIKKQISHTSLFSTTFHKDWHWVIKF